MKKKAISSSKQFSSVVIYLEDLKEIIGILEESGQIVKISDSNYEYEDLEDLINSSGRKKCTNLSLNISKPYISVDFRRSPFWGTTLYYNGEGVADKGIYYAIKEILIKRTRKMSKVFGYYQGLAAVFLLVVCFKVLDTIKVVDSIPIGVRRGVVISVLAFAFISFSWAWGSTTKILLKNREEVASFFFRNKDDLLKILIGVVVTLVTQWLWSLLFAGS